MNTRKQIAFLAAALVLGLSVTVTAHAATKFSKDLSFGTRNSADVKNLQQFLSQEGYFKGEITGNYFNATSEAVKSFQKSNKINPTGYFGPMTRAAVNSKSADALLSLTSHKGGETIEVGNKQALKWTASNYSSDNVKVNVIKKVSSNPNRYELVRSVSDKTLNDGVATWIPAKSDIGNNVFIEIGCKDTTKACRSAVTASSLAVVNSNKYMNTASAYSALEKEDNK
ncbi:MAG: peptidoglycan-binding domain-containing protein [Patescibacteria group bacterium]